MCEYCIFSYLFVYCVTSWMLLVAELTVHFGRKEADEMRRDDMGLRLGEWRGCYIEDITTVDRTKWEKSAVLQSHTRISTRHDGKMTLVSIIRRRGTVQLVISTACLGQRAPA
jgi:hypothetical protein